MSQTQSIIVYRNPAEQAFWESGMLFPIFSGIAIFFVVLMLCNSVGNVALRSFPKQNTWKNQARVGYASIAAAAIVGVYVVYSMIQVL